tara:strand:+ start:524 stop:751 length:228 start_codon:yes stop_codon:yes gene_type:complete
MKSTIRKFLKDAKNAGPLSRDQIRAEANIGLNLMSLIRAWGELAEDSRNKTEWNDFAKFVLNEVADLSIIIKEER